MPALDRPPATSDDDRLLSIPQAARDVIGITPASLWTAVQMRRIPAIPVGARGWAIRLRDAVAYKDKHAERRRRSQQAQGAARFRRAQAAKAA